MTVILDHHEDLDLETYRRVVAGEPVAIAPAALERVQSGRDLLERLLADGEPAYGVTTGLGYLHGSEIPQEERSALQRALVTARAAGLGEPLPAKVVRGVVLLRVNAFLSGLVGVRPELCVFLADRLGDGWSPVVPRGPYGAAGEIGPLAHLFQTIVGEGTVRDGERELPATAALAERGLTRFELAAKEGLALINGSPFATALGVELAGRFRALLEGATFGAALTIACAQASVRPFSRRIGELSRDPAQLGVHERLLELLGDGPGGDGVQPPVSFRAVPQVHGAARAAVDGLESALELRLGAVTDSPLVLPAAGAEPAGFYPSGGFHAAAVGRHLDGLAVAAAHLTNLVEKRLHRLLDTRFSGLPEQLSVAPGRHAGVVSLHKAAVGLAAEARLLAAPASVHALDTSSGQEDVQAFTFLAAERLGRSLDALESAVACELVAGRQAAFLRSPAVGFELAGILEALGAAIRPVDDDRSLSEDIEQARILLRAGLGS